MARLVSGFFLLLSFLDAVAQAPAEPPVEVNDFAIAVFVIIFVGVCVGFAWMVWRNHKLEQRRKTEK